MSYPPTRFARPPGGGHRQRPGEAGSAAVAGWADTGRLDAIALRAVRWMMVLAAVLASAALWWPLPTQAARVKEVSSVAGVRPNQLSGYGLVVGLDGSESGIMSATTGICTPQKTIVMRMGRRRRKSRILTFFIN